MKRRLFAPVALCISAVWGFGQKAIAQNSSSVAWTSTIERALAAQGLESSAIADVQNGVETLHLTVNGKTVIEPVSANFDALDYSSTVYVIIDGIESRMRYMAPVRGTTGGQLRSTGLSSHGGRIQRKTGGTSFAFDPVREWHSHSTIYKPDEIYEDTRDLDLLEVSLQRGVSNAVRAQLVDASYARSIPADQQLLLLRARVIDMQHGEVFEKPKEGSPANAPLKVSRRLAYANINIQLVDDMTGAVVWQDNLYDDDYTSLMTGDPMEDCLKSIANSLTSALDKMYPYSAPRLSAEGLVTEVASSNKGKVATFYIDLGSDQELKKGDALTVYVEQVVAGNVGLKQIGTANVTDVQGPSLSLCKVRKGEKEIYNAIEAGETLVVKTNW